VAVTSTNGFTLDKRYKVQRLTGYKDRLALVLNDNGHERIVGLDGRRSAHLLAHDEPAGYFEIVND